MRILIIKLSSLGDLFHALPAVHNLKVSLDAQIDWVTNKGYVDLVRCFDDVDDVIGFPRKAFSANFNEFKKQLRAKEYDLIIDMQGLLKSALTARLARGSRRIGPSFHREGSKLFYNSVAGPCDRTRHAVIENLDIISHLKLEKIQPEFHVTFPQPAAEPDSLDLFPKKQNAERPQVAICPASRWKTKNWPTERFAEVAKKLQESMDASITLLGGPEDIETCRIIEDILEKPCRNLAGKTSIIEMGGILQNVDLLIANDSGPSHMAAAVNTPTLVIFGPTNPDRTRPFGDIHHVLKTAYPCQPCHSRICQNPDIPCINGVKIYQVLDKAKEMLTNQ
jgi:lipopolysaccharide heptosyltransferase I